MLYADSMQIVAPIIVSILCFYFSPNKAHISNTFTLIQTHTLSYQLTRTLAELKSTSFNKPCVNIMLTLLFNSKSHTSKPIFECIYLKHSLNSQAAKKRSYREYSYARIMTVSPLGSRGIIYHYIFKGKKRHIDPTY